MILFVFLHCGDIPAIVKNIDNENMQLEVDFYKKKTVITTSTSLYIPKHIYLLKKFTKEPVIDIHIEHGQIIKTSVPIRQAVIKELQSEIKSLRKTARQVSYRVPHIVYAGHVFYTHTFHIEIDLDWAKTVYRFDNRNMLDSDPYKGLSFYDTVKNGSEISFFKIDSGDILNIVSEILYESYNNFEIVTETKDSLIIDISPKNTRVYHIGEQESVFRNGVEYILN